MSVEQTWWLGLKLCIEMRLIIVLIYSVMRVHACSVFTQFCWVVPAHVFPIVVGGS